MATSVGNESVASSTTSGDSQKGVRYSKDYNLISINILSGRFPIIDFKPIMVELSYFEDIFNNVSSGQLYVCDSQGMIEKMGMHGNEYIRLAFDKDDNPDLRIDKIFRIYKISSSDLQNYIIHFCSDELLLSMQTKISKSYKDYKISDIIKDILKVRLKVPGNKYNERNIEDTKGTYSFIIPNFSPFEAANWLCMYAQSASPGNIGSDMIVYENNEGFNFKSLQSLFKKSAYFTYQYRPTNMSEKQHSNSDKQTFNVLSYEIINSFNTLEGISSGMFANRVLTIDPLLRRYATVDFNYNEYRKKASSLNNNPIVNNLQNRFGKTLYETPQGCYKLSTTNSKQTDVTFIKTKPNSTSKDVSTETFLSQRKSQLALSNYTRIKFFIPGDPNVSVGTTINFQLMSQEPAAEKKPIDYDEYYSGKYLVTAVRHMLQTGGYNTVIEAVKDSVPNAYQSVDNNSSLWKNTVSGVKK
jgi:hypothetical protein